jgi:hypothetical protein
MIDSHSDPHSILPVDQDPDPERQKPPTLKKRRKINSYLKTVTYSLVGQRFFLGLIIFMEDKKVLYANFL